MLDALFSRGGYSPHGYCIAWDPVLLWTHVGSDVLIAAAYFSIPAGILVFVRKRADPALAKPGMLFTAFIMLCGITHLMGIVTLWTPLYGLHGLMKVATAAVSVVTAVILWRMLPAALLIPSRNELIAANDALRDEIERGNRDREELARSRAQITQKMGELEAANQELTEFAYAASHDLKSPANTLSLWISEFEIDYGERLGDEGRRDLAEARAILDRMRMLIDDVLHYSRIVSADLDHPVEVDLSAIATEAIADQAQSIRDADADVQLTELPTIRGHPGLLRILMHNLLDNALKFRAQDRPLTVRIVPLPHGTGFAIADNGIGICPHHHEKIFRMFKRLNGHDQFEGTGLGLALCRRAVLSHGGTITVHSDGSSGTTFQVHLRREAQHAQMAA